MVGLTVLFSTYNGAATLPRMLDSLERVEAPAGGWKVVAVDNASTDNSAALLRDRQGRLPITVLSESRRGKNAALNTGLGAVEGDLVVFTDDDVMPQPDWLAAMRGIVDKQRDFDIFGGAIHPVWLEPPPAWILRCVPKGHFAWTDFAEGPIDPGCVWGPNMAVRRSVFDSFRFFEDIGPDGCAQYPTGSEVEFTRRAARSGHRCWHSHQIVVGHIIRSYQLTPDWLLQRTYNHAMGARRLHGRANEDSLPHLFGQPRYLVRQLAEALLYASAARLIGRFEDRFQALDDLRRVQGDLAERRIQKRSNRAKRSWQRPFRTHRRTSA